MSGPGCIFEHMFDEGDFPPDLRLPDDAALLSAADLLDTSCWISDLDDTHCPVSDLDDTAVQMPDLDDTHWQISNPADASSDTRRIRQALLLERLAKQAPNASLVAMLATVDPTSLNPDDGITYLQILERVIAWCHSLQSDALVAVAGPQSRVDRYLAGDGAGASSGVGASNGVNSYRAAAEIEDVIRDEVSAALNWTGSFTQRRINVARHLAGPLLETSRALAWGLISYPQAAMISESADRLPGAGGGSEGEQRRFSLACRQLQERVLPIAHRSTLGRARQAAERALLAIDAEHARARRRATARGHDVFVVGEADGNALLIARMKAQHAQACLTAVESLAQSPDLAIPGNFSVGQRRAAALAALLIGQPSEAPPGGAAAPPHPVVLSTAPPHPVMPNTAPPHPVMPNTAPPAVAAQPVVHLDIVIGLESLLALNSEPGLVRGVGPIPAEEVRELLEDATMRRLVSDPLTGHLLDYGRKTYRVSDRLREFIQARDGTCRFPGCSRRAERCQIDHAESWRDGGTTSLANLGALCIRHHQLKTHGGWRIVASDESGACTWVSPLGRRYDHRAAPLLGNDTPTAKTTGETAPCPAATCTLTDAHEHRIEQGPPPRPDPPPF